jgi:hypothetical protein
LYFKQSRLLHFVFDNPKWSSVISFFCHFIHLFLLWPLFWNPKYFIKSLNVLLIHSLKQDEYNQSVFIIYGFMRYSTMKVSEMFEILIIPHFSHFWLQLLSEIWLTHHTDWTLYQLWFNLMKNWLIFIRV